MKSKFTQDDFDSIKALKTDVNLVEFACHKFGYLPDWEHPTTGGDKRKVKSSANSIKLIHKDDPLDTLIVSKNPTNQQFVYKSLCDSSDKGTIVDFVKNRFEDFSFSKLRKMCKNYLSATEKGLFKSYLGSRPGFANSLNGNVEMPKIEAFQFYLKPANDKSYLKNRGLSDETINNHFKLTYNLNEQNDTVSFVIPYYKVDKNPDNSYSLSLHTYQKYSEDSTIQKKFIKGGKMDSVWLNSVDKTKPVTSMVISESPLDSASYAELKKEQCGKNPLLTASGGDFGLTVSDTFTKLIDMTKVDNVILANDNDCKGQRYNAQVLAALPVSKLVEDDFLEKNKGLEEAKINVGFSLKTGFVEWNFSHDKFSASSQNYQDKLNQILPVFVQVRDYYMQENQDLKEINNNKDVFKIDTNFGENSSYIKLEFQNTKDNWELVNDSLLFLKYGNSEQLQIDKSICKDWNDDLKIIKGVNFKPLKEDQELLQEFVKAKLIDEKQVQKIEKELGFSEYTNNKIKGLKL